MSNSITNLHEKTSQKVSAQQKGVEMSDLTENHIKEEEKPNALYKLSRIVGYYY